MVEVNPFPSPVPTIQTIEVIERWVLCHHLGCVVEYLALTDPKGPSEGNLKNLQKAEWYLLRELSRPQPCPFFPMGNQPFTTEDVLDGWGLPFHLGEVLFHIKASKSPSMRGESLRQALQHLQAETATYRPLPLKPSIHPTGEETK